MYVPFITEPGNIATICWGLLVRLIIFSRDFMLNLSMLCGIVMDSNFSSLRP